MSTIDFAGRRWVASASGSLWEPEKRIWVAADLHLGKSRDFVSGGRYLPPYDIQETLDRLETELRDRNPATVVLLGDSFHRPESWQQLGKPLQNRLLALTRQRTWIWVSGNHDPAIIEGEAFTSVDQWDGNGVRYRHQPVESEETPVLFGHFHPKIRLSLRGRNIPGKVFLVDEQRCLLPAFGAYTGGLYWPDPALKRWFRKPRFFFCHQNRVTEVRAARVQA